ncbi:hypothetical protein NM688_g8922 [Phlebia brevispora]|uniref:Uncharacterized protein n=1 Tax=Phlebia brevispora TaxID=194682 RepID=A0ACC1RQU7_9APHY|nr:hypothetical protein NM688_g8922 [Phlebia brevispora]
MIGIAGAGLLSVLLMKEVPMQDVTDDKYGLHAEEGVIATDEEKADSTSMVTPVGPSAESQRPSGGS